MPTVPRNTITQTRIDRTPGVSSVTPQGAEGIGAVASAVGRMADMTGANARSIAHEGQAVQNVIEGVGNLAVTMDRIDRVRMARQVDEGELDYHQHMNNGTTGYDDPETGEHVQGAYETPFSPKDEQNEGSSAQQATAKLHASWFEKKDGPFSRMTPRAQEEAKKWLTAKFLVYEGNAKGIDERNRIIRRKAIDEASTKANLDFVAQNAANPATRGAAIKAAAASMTLQGNRHLITNPDAATIDEARFTDDKTQSAFGQAMKDNTAKVSLHVADSLLTQADAAPDDATASKLLVDAVAFSNEAEGKGLFAPDTVAKIEKDAQGITRERERRAKAQYAEKVNTARDMSIKYRNGLVTKDEYDASLANIAAPDAGLIIKDDELANVADDKHRFDAMYARYVDTGNKDELDMRIATLKTDQGRTYASLILKEQSAKKANAEARTLRDLEKIDRENRGLIATTLAKAGLAVDDQGNYVPLEPYEVRHYALAAHANGLIDNSQMHDVMDTLQQKADKDTVLTADAAMTVVSKRFGVDEADLKKWFAFKAKQGLYDIALNKKKTGPEIKPEKVVGEYRWQDGQDDDEEVAKLRADLVCSILNAAVEYSRAPHLPGKGRFAGSDPMTTEQFIDSLLTADYDGKARKLDDAIIRRNTENAMMLTLGVQRRLAANMASAMKLNAMKQLQEKATAPATDDTENQ